MLIPPAPEPGQPVSGRSMLGKPFKGTVVALTGEHGGRPLVKVAVLREEHLYSCFWFPDQATGVAASGQAPWQMCWPSA